MSDAVDSRSGIEALTQRFGELLRELQEQRVQLTRLTRAQAIDAQQFDRSRARTGER